VIAAKKDGGKPPSTLPKPTAVPSGAPITPTAMPAAPVAPSVAVAAPPAKMDVDGDDDLDDDEFEARETCAD